MCECCRDEIVSGPKKCSRCGKPVNNSIDSFVNPNFDDTKFNELAYGTDTDDIEDDESEDIEHENIEDEEIDIELLRQLEDVR